MWERLKWNPKEAIDGQLMMRFSPVTGSRMTVWSETKKWRPSTGDVKLLIANSQVLSLEVLPSVSIINERSFRVKRAH